MNTVQDIAIVILNWNGKTLLQKFLPSVIRYSKGATLYVADNASTDNSVSFLEEHFKDVKIIQNTSNGGYAKGYNQALKQVKEPILCLLNSDVEVTENWLHPILKAYNTYSEVAIIQPKILDYKNKSYFEYAGAAGGFIDKFAFPYCRGRIFDTLEKDNGQYNEQADIFWASGACFFIRTSVFELLKGFDTLFFAHMEEIDLCWRAFNKGYKCMYIGASTVFHVGGATLKTSNPKKTYLNFRNSLFTLTKNTDKNLTGRLCIRMFLDGIAATKYLLSLKPKHFWAVLKAHFAFYMTIPKLLGQRRALIQLPNYYHKKSIVWDFFIRKKQEFKCL